jgi:hypothetical protein
MSISTLSMKEIFAGFQDKEAFFDRISEHDYKTADLLNQYLFLSLFLFAYGFIMGCYNSLLQALSAGIKVPLLITLTLFICFPAFYTLQFILGSKLSFKQMMAIILSGFMITATIMVSFAPIVLFFIIIGSNYAFLKLLHVAVFSMAGFVGMRTVLEALKFSCDKKSVYPKIGVRVFQVWVLLMAFVGTQLAWNLRPFLGAKDQPWELLRSRGGNFYETVLKDAFGLIVPDKPGRPGK